MTTLTQCYTLFSGQCQRKCKTRLDKTPNQMLRECAIVVLVVGVVIVAGVLVVNSPLLSLTKTIRETWKVSDSVLFRFWVLSHTGAVLLHCLVLSIASFNFKGWTIIGDSDDSDEVDDDNNDNDNDGGFCVWPISLSTSKSLPAFSHWYLALLLHRALHHRPLQRPIWKFLWL